MKTDFILYNENSNKPIVVNEKSNTELKHIKTFSTRNIELLSKTLNYKRLDIHNKNIDLVKPYKLEDENKTIIVSGFGGK